MNNLSIAFLVIGVLILLSNLIDVPYLVSKMFAKSKNKVNVPSENKEEGFLEIVSLWYQLKTKCDEYHLTIASNKLDEVFPLLNKVIEEDTNEKTS